MVYSGDEERLVNHCVLACLLALLACWQTESDCSSNHWTRKPDGGLSELTKVSCVWVVLWFGEERVVDRLGAGFY